MSGGVLLALAAAAGFAFDFAAPIWYAARRWPRTERQRRQLDMHFRLELRVRDMRRRRRCN